MSPPSYIPLTSNILSTTDGTIFCPHNDSSWDLMGRRITAGIIIAGAFGWAYFQSYNNQSSKNRSNKNIKFCVFKAQKNSGNDNAIREKYPNSIDENSDITLRGVASLSSVCSTSNVSTQCSPLLEQPTQQPSSSTPFQDGPIGSVDEEPPNKNGTVTKSIQCGGGNCGA